MQPTVVLLTAAVNLGVGLLIGWSGIAGFLLPMFYTTGLLGLPVPEALTLSFAAFAVSGTIGALGYRKRGNLPQKMALPLMAGSLAGAAPGVALNTLIPAGAVKLMLYLVVLASGVSILLRERGVAKAGKTMAAPPGQSLIKSPPAMAALGFATALVCALSGAGGPILVMPLLVVLGMDVRSAVGLALLDSVFIALPSIVGYGLQSAWHALLPLLPVALAAHALGVLAGSRSCHIIRQRALKTGVALLSIGIALYMIFSTLWLQ